MWLTLIGFLLTLWAVSLLIWLPFRWMRPGDKVHRPPVDPIDRF